MAKIVEKLACHQLVAFFERLKLAVTKPAVCFIERSIRQKRLYVLKVITDVQHAADRGEVSLLCMLDLSAAFDTVDYCTLRLQQSLGVQRPALYPGLSSSFVIDPRLSAVLQVIELSFRIQIIPDLLRAAGQCAVTSPLPGLLC